MVVHDSHGNELPMDGRVNATPNMNASMQQQRADPRQQSRAEQRADSQQQQAGPQQSRDQTTNDHQSSANQLIDCQEVGHLHGTRYGLALTIVHVHTRIQRFVTMQYPLHLGV